MIAEKRGDIPYLLGLIFFIAAIVYFFASNWPGFDRPVKIGLSLAVLLACALAAFAYRRSRTFAYLSNWWLLLSVAAFGVSVALIGQMYNSHANSYILFSVTLLPAAFLAFSTRYRPLYWLSFVLFELAFWLKLYPTGLFKSYSDGEQLLIYTGAFALHGLLYAFWRKLGEEKLSFAALLVGQYCALYLLLTHMLYDIFAGDMAFRFVFFWLHAAYAALIVVFWKAFMHSQKRHPLETGIHLVCFGVYIVPNVFYIWFQIMGEFIFYAGFPMLLILFALSIAGLRKITASSSGQNTKWKSYMIVFFTSALAFVGTLIAVFSLSSFVGLLFGFSGDFSISFLVLAVLCIGAGLTVQKASWLVVRMTLQITGLVFAFSYVLAQWEAWWPAVVMAVPFLLLTGFLFQRKESMLYYIAANTALLYGIFHLLSDNGVSFSVSTWVLFSAGAGNAAVFLSLKEKPVGLAGFWLSLVFTLYSLTEEGWDSLFLHAVFLGYIVWHLLSPALRTRLYRWPLWTAVAFFLVWKYYEFAWLLLHKSLAFFLISAFFFLVWFAWGRNHTAPVAVNKWSIPVFASVLALQLLFIGVTVWQKEQLLQTGEVAALELEPLDPRSLLQGDYVQLRYAVEGAYSDRFFSSDAPVPEGRIAVVLAPTGKSVEHEGKQVPVYEAAHFVSSDRATGLAITAIAESGNLAMGIEHFFIPENSGVRWEQKTHAIVRIAKNGDALLETLR